MPISTDPVKRAKQLANLRGSGGGASPTFAAGNGAAVRHGAYARIAESELNDKARTIFDAIASDAPVREIDGGLPAGDALVVRMLAEVMVRRERVRVEELRHGIEAPDGKLRGVVEYGLRLDHQALEMARELGLTPASRVKLGLELVRGITAAEQLDRHLQKTYGGGGS